MEDKLREYMREKSDKKSFFGGVKIIAGGFVALVNPIAGVSLIATGLNDVSEASKMYNATRE